MFSRDKTKRLAARCNGRKGNEGMRVTPCGSVDADVEEALRDDPRGFGTQARLQSLLDDTQRLVIRHVVLHHRICLLLGRLWLRITLAPAAAATTAAAATAADGAGAMPYASTRTTSGGGGGGGWATRARGVAGTRAVVGGVVAFGSSEEAGSEAAAKKSGRRRGGAETPHASPAARGSDSGGGGSDGAARRNERGYRHRSRVRERVKGRGMT